MIREFECTWADYLTKCKDFPNIEIGSYECSQCKYFGGFAEQVFINPGDYFTIAIGCINCNKDN